MNLTNFLKKATSYLLAILMLTSVFIISPIYTSAYENDKLLACATQIDVGSTVMIKKGAVAADNLKTLNSFWYLFEFLVEEVTNGVAEITYSITKDTAQEYQLTADKVIEFLNLDPEINASTITIIRVSFSVLEVVPLPVKFQVALEDLILIKDGTMSTDEELKYIGKEVSIKKGAVNADGDTIDDVWSLLVYDVTTVVDRTAHIQCTLLPRYIEELGMTKETLSKNAKVDSNNEVCDLLYDKAIANGYTVNHDIDIKYLNFSDIDLNTDTETDIGTDFETDLVSDIDTGSDTETDITYETDTDISTNTESDTETETDTADTNSDTDTETNTDTATDSDTESDVVSDTDTGSDTETDTNTDTEQPTDTDTSTDTEKDAVIGDVDGDGQVTMIDVVKLQKAVAQLVELNEDEIAAADVNNDEKLNMEDVVLIQKYIAKLIDSFNKK